MAAANASCEGADRSNRTKLESASEKDVKVNESRQEMEAMTTPDEYSSASLLESESHDVSRKNEVKMTSSSQTIISGVGDGRNERSEIQFQTGSSTGGHGDLIGAASDVSCKRNSGPGNKEHGSTKHEEAATAEDSKPGISEDTEKLRGQLQRLLHILETSQDAEEKKATLQQISHLAEEMKDVIRIELDDDDGDSSDGRSTTSSPEPLLDIPLPALPTRQTISSDVCSDLVGIPLPDSRPPRTKCAESTLFFDEDSSDMPPLPPLPAAAVETSDKRPAEKRNQDSRRGSQASAKSKGKHDEESYSIREEDALQTNTSLGPVTLHVNKKLVPRLVRASVFDLKDENAKEIGRKLLRLKKLKKLRKLDDVGEHKIDAKDRISMWKEELLGDSRNTLPSNPVAPSAAAVCTPDQKVEEKTTSTPVSLMSLNVLTPPSVSCPAKVESLPVDATKDVSNVKDIVKDEKNCSSKPFSFVRVLSKCDKKELNWPVEMVQSTKFSPKVCYSCNPLEFNFGLPSAAKDSETTMERLKIKDKRKKKKKSHESSSRRKKESHKSNPKEERKEDETQMPGRVRTHSAGTSSCASADNKHKKLGTDSVGAGDANHPKELKSNDGHQKKPDLGESRKKSTTASSLKTVAGKNKSDETDVKSSKHSVFVLDSKGALDLNSKEKKSVDGAKKSKRPKIALNSETGDGRKRKISGGDAQQPSKRPCPSGKSVDALQKNSVVKVSDFEEAGHAGGGPGKWDTSSDSEPDMPRTNKAAEKSAVPKTESGKAEHRSSRRSRSSSSERGSSSSQEYTDSDNESASRSRSRSYSSYSSSSSYRSRSYSSDYCYRRSRSSTRSRSRRRHSYSYSDDSYHSKSRSYSRSRGGRSRSSSYDRDRSYSTHSRSSRSYSRSRSRSRSRRRSDRSYYKDKYYRRKSDRLRSDRSRAKAVTKSEQKQEPKAMVASNRIKKTEELSAENKSTTLKSVSNADVANGISAAVGTTEIQRTGGETPRAKAQEKSALSDETSADPELKLSEIPRPQDKNPVTIPLPSDKSRMCVDGKNYLKASVVADAASVAAAAGAGQSFIGPTLPMDHPLAHIQDIPIPQNEQFQPIGPNDPLVFKKPLLPPPPPPTFLTDPNSKSDPPLPPNPNSPPPLPNDWSALEDIAGDEEPIPHMLDLGTIKPAMIIPPEQAEQYKALQQQAQLHARQRMRQEAGLPDEEEEAETMQEEAQQQQLLEDMLLEQAAQNATFLTTQPVLHIPQQQLLAPALASAAAPQVMVGSTGFFQVPMSMQMVSTGHPHGLVTLAGPSVVPVLPQAGAPMVIAAQPSGAMSALIRAHEAQAQAEAAEEAEAQAKAQVQASLLQASQQHEWVQIIQMPGSGRAVAVPAHAIASSMPHAIAMQSLRPASIQMHHGVIPVHAMNHHALHQQAVMQPVSLGLPLRMGLPSGVVGAPQMLASSAQPQGMPLLIDHSGNILFPRLLRPGHL